jgi:FlaA1/EpsC-like NDP-sugar epimerase
VISAALDTGVKTVVALSTDKAAAPINLYGATKLCADKLFIAANNIRGKRNCKFTIVRYGNVMGSRGSVIPLFLNQRNEKTLSITDPEMTRFNISLEEGVNLVLYAIGNSLGGEIFVPKIPSYRILDVAEAISPGAEIKFIGIRPGEKIHEEMITAADSINTLDIGDYYVILPTSSELRRKKFIEFHNGRFVEKGFSYNSGDNDQWLTVDDIRRLIREHVNPNIEF